MWKDIKNKPDELNTFLKETASGGRGRTSTWRDDETLCITFWMSNSIQGKLDALLRHLKTQSKLFDSESALSLSELAVDLLVFQEKNFGRGCQERMQGMLIPVSCFYDLTESGGFATIITNVRQFCLKESMPLKEL